MPRLQRRNQHMEGETVMDLNTDNKQEAFERTMMFLGKQEELDRRRMCKLLTKGNQPYSRTEDASSFLKDLVDSEKFPVEKDGKKLVRTDLNRVIVNDS